MGHAETEVGDLYSKLKDDVLFRQQWADRIGLGFELVYVGTQNQVAVETEGWRLIRRLCTWAPQGSGLAVSGVEHFLLIAGFHISKRPYAELDFTNGQLGCRDDLGQQASPI